MEAVVAGTDVQSVLVVFLVARVVLSVLIVPVVLGTEIVVVVLRVLRVLNEVAATVVAAQVQVMIAMIAGDNVISASVIIVIAWNIFHVYELDVELFQLLWLRQQLPYFILRLGK